MSHLLNEAIKQAVDLHDLKVGEGDLTTESLSPYARHTEATIRASKEVSWFPFDFFHALMTHGDDSLVIQANDGVAVPVSPGEILARVAGNGRAIVTGWRVVAPLLSLMSSVREKVAGCSEVLRPANIEVRHNFDLPVGYDRIIRYAVEAGGGISFGVTLDEIVYISPDHVRWAGTLRQALKRALEEVGDKRSLIKVVLEISDPQEVSDLGDLKADLVYCKGFDVTAIGQVKDFTKGWVRLMVDETIPLDGVVNLRHSGVRVFMVDLNQFLTPKQLYTITFDR